VIGAQMVAKKLRRRRQILEEIIKTEQTFVASLGVCIEYYLLPLVKLAREWGARRVRAPV
jgi:hypothetical protein